MKEDSIDERLERLRLEKEVTVDMPEAVEHRLKETLRRIRAEAAVSLSTSNPSRRLNLVTPPIDTHIQSVDVEAKRSHSNPPKKQYLLRRLAVVTVAGALLLGVGLAGLGYVSPAFADTMRSVPLLGNLLSIYGDKGIQAASENNLVQPVAATETRGDSTISVRNVIYDGTRIVLEVHRTGEGKFYSTNLSAPERGELTSVETYLQEQQLLPSWRPAGENTVLVSINLHTELPSRFTLRLRMTLSGVEQPFEFDVPVEINTDPVVIENPKMPDSLAQHGFVVDKVVVTPVTTQVFFHLRPKAEDTNNNFVHPDDFDMSDARDEQGHIYETLGGQGDPETESGSKQYYIFEPVDPEARTLNLTFNVAGGPDGKPYSIEMEVPLPDRPADSKS
ncbi:uncharacterized protein DUF4179 [Paenibacillus cellulosilyticus]|uniref:Uncharacterized protein DUF4179 n=1 Tax=Paenibacillus cellulosilyticus TaxID=375489 RepID=A0A2V2YU63_9BACL|nr:DUF4179 domain-containing protein [Paenibacillus cellulosilyticus]PWW02797.1 uncharacterized protein DUF4179 [Paenibacillus cellulosilyticus]QKS45720.1 DUF4179 domain-containing protein [Paenibacillus cellulosilyticus]